MKKIVALAIVLGFAGSLAFSETKSKDGDCVHCGPKPEPTIQLAKADLAATVSSIENRLKKRNPASVTISNENQNTFCSLIERGKYNLASDLIEDNYKVPVSEAYTQINCNPLRERSELPGIDPMNWAINKTKVSSAYAAIIDMLQYFQDEPQRAKFFANVLFCKKNHEKRCGRTCYKYIQRDVFEEIDYQIDNLENGTTKDTLNDVKKQLNSHLKKFNFKKEDHDPKACPKHLSQRRPETSNS